MPIYQNLAVFAAFLLIYSIFAGRFESRLLNGPLLFMLAGLILGPAALGLLQPDIPKEGIKFLAELTLAIVLFSDAATANLRVLRSYNQIWCTGGLKGSAPRISSTSSQTEETFEWRYSWVSNGKVGAWRKSWRRCWRC